MIYALRSGAVDRGFHYLDRYPGVGGWLMFAACTGVVFMAGAKLLDHTRRDTGERRRDTDDKVRSLPDTQGRSIGRRSGDHEPVNDAPHPSIVSAGQGGLLLSARKEATANDQERVAPQPATLSGVDGDRFI